VGALTAGIATAGDPTLLPASFKSSLSSPPKPGDAVKLGNLQAYRYAGLQPKNYPQQLTVYTVPTDAGVATVACSAAAAQAATFLPECERAASTLTLSGAQAFDLGVPKSYADALNSTLSKLQSARKSALARLKSAKTVSAQAAAARQAANAYLTAAKSVKALKPPPQLSTINTGFFTLLTSGALGYNTMAQAVARGDRSGYLAAAADVKKADRELVAALKDLAKLA
jgi:hypothetical protein